MGNKIHIAVGDIYSTISEPRKNAKALALVRQVCRARPNGYMFMPKYKKGHWDGYISLMNSLTRFPTGLLPFVREHLERNDFEVAIHWEVRKEYEAVTPDFLEGITLRDYQVDAANELLANGRGIAKMATNSGKTEVMAAIIKALDSPTMVVLHRKELMHQTADRFENRLGGNSALRTKVGMIGDGIFDPKQVTVAMVQTLSNKIGDMNLEDNLLLLVDECHHGSSDQMLDVLHQIPGQYRFGFSGTPLKRDVLADMKLMSATGLVLVDVSNEYLIDEGYSAEPVVKMAVVEDSEDENWEMEYQDAYDKLIVNNDDRNLKIAELAMGGSGTVLILVERIEHGNILSDLIDNSVFVHGGHNYYYRESVLEKMRNGNGGIYIASPIFDEGVDVPSIDVVVIAGGGKSNVKLLQRVGRGMRKKGGDKDNRLIIYDFIDDTNKYLLEHSERRIDTYVDENFSTERI